MARENTPRARRYEVRRLGLGAAARAAMLFGLLLWLCPALLLGGAAVTALRGLNDAVSGLERFTIPLPVLSLLNISYDIPDVNIDVVDQLGYSEQAGRVQALAAQEGLVFVGVTVATLLFGSALFALPTLLFASLYNAFMPLFGGLVIELRERP